MSKKLTYEFVKQQFENEGYELLSKGYINSWTKLKYICPKGHEHNIKWSDWQQERRCPYCAGQGRPTIEFIRSEFAKEGYEFLVTKYKNAHQKLNYICDKGHKHSITWTNWCSGQRCPYCVGVAKKTIGFIEHEFEKDNYVLLTNQYINCDQKLDYICPKGHRHNISWLNWSSGKRCPYCSGKDKKTIEFVRSEFEKENYTLLSTEYKNNSQKLDYICPEGHKHNISWGNWRQGKRCPECTNGVSRGEIEVRNFIESLGIKVSANNRSQIFNPETGNGLELDIFMPDFNKAIEYNGEYWHQDKNRDLLKQQLCKSKDIDLMTIWDKEWFNNSRKYKEKIMKFMF